MDLSETFKIRLENEEIPETGFHPATSNSIKDFNEVQLSAITNITE